MAIRKNPFDPIFYALNDPDMVCDVVLYKPASRDEYVKFNDCDLPPHPFDVQGMFAFYIADEFYAVPLTEVISIRFHKSGE